MKFMIGAVAKIIKRSIFDNGLISKNNNYVVTRRSIFIHTLIGENANFSNFIWENLAII